MVSCPACRRSKGAVVRSLGSWSTTVRGGAGAGRQAGLVLCAIATIGLTLALTPLANAAGRSFTGAAVAASARRRALDMYREDQTLDAHRPHKRRAGARRARAAVVGGAQDSIEEIPWQVAVFAEFEVEGKKAALLCGGSIISMSHIVTAGHCAYNPVTGQPLPAQSFIVLAGASSITVEEIEHGPTVQAHFVEGVRIHPDFDYAAGPGTPDDIAVLGLVRTLNASSAVRTIALPSSASGLPEGTDGVLSGFGEENPITEELNGKLYSLGIALGSSRECGGDAEAVFLCGSNTGGSACNGDSGGSLIRELDGGLTLIGVIDTVQVVDGERCRHGALDGFVNVAAPEIRDFVEGSEDPPLAPRGEGASLLGEPTVGQTLTCEPGSWSNDPNYTYAFVNSAHGEVLQQGSSPTYLLHEPDFGRAILCELQATNAGGTGTARTPALAPVQHAPFIPPPPPGGGTTTGSGGSAGGGSSIAGSGGGPSTGVPANPGSGGVLGETNTKISSAQIAALLKHELTPAGKSAKLAIMLETGGFTITFKALDAGTAIIDWYELPPGATLARKTKAKPILVASGRAMFPAAGTTRIKVKLSTAGKHLLKSTKSLTLTAKGTFISSGEAPVVAIKTFVLKK